MATPVKQYYVQLPGFDQGEMWDEEKFNRNKEQLYQDHPDAMAYETTKVGDEEDYDSADLYNVHVPGFEKGETWDAEKFQRNRAQLMADHPDVEVYRMRPVGSYGDQIREQYSQQASHEAAMGDLYKEEGDDWRTEGGMEQVAKLRKRMQDLKGKVEDYDEQVKKELGTIPGQKERYIRQSQLEPTRADLRKQYEEAANAYYNDPYVIEGNKLGAQKANKANEEMAEYMKPILDERKERNEKRNPYLVAGAAGVGGNAALPSYDEQLYTAAKNINDDTIRIYEAPSKYGSENGANNFLKGAWDRVSTTDFWTMGLTGIADQYVLNDVLKKMRDEIGGINDITEENIDKALNPMEKQLPGHLIMPNNNNTTKKL